METYCNGCYSNHQELMNTWTKKGSLQPSNYDPFKGHNQHHTGGHNQHHTGSHNRPYTGGYNQPDAGGHNQPHAGGHNQPYTGRIINNRHKEKFSCNPNNTYSSLDHTWMKQKPYSSN